MFGLFKKDPIKKLEKEYLAKMKEARDIQRGGDMKAYALFMEEAEKMADELARLKEAKNKS
ncbi:MAG: DUF6435 family protein [Thermonemataceae bacterium]